MLFTVVALIVGAMIFLGGFYYLIKEKSDQEARKIYLITTVAGAVILAGVIVRTMLLG